jgi:hypothetical protein
MDMTVNDFMRFQTLRPSKSKVLSAAASTGILFVCLGLASSSGTSMSRDALSSRIGSEPSNEAVALANAQARRVVRVVRFKLYDIGILPREAYVEKGLVAISIEDYSGGTAGLVVARETGGPNNRVGRMIRQGPHWRSRGEMQLGPGRYQVFMEDRPDNRALLIVEP